MWLCLQLRNSNGKLNDFSSVTEMISCLAFLQQIKTQFKQLDCCKLGGTGLKEKCLMKGEIKFQKKITPSCKHMRTQLNMFSKAVQLL